MIEIVVVCSMVMCPPKFVEYAERLASGEVFSSATISPLDGMLRPFCFINATKRDGYIRVVKWTNVEISVETSGGIEVCYNI